MLLLNKKSYKTLGIVCLLSSVADPDPWSGAFLTPWSGIGFFASQIQPMIRSASNYILYQTIYFLYMS